jgi:hypothetical protein
MDGLKLILVTSLITSIAWNQRGFNTLPVPILLVPK